MGAGRSLAKLLGQFKAAEEKTGQKQGKRQPTNQLSTLENWSSKNRWQERIKEYVAEVHAARREKMLSQAAKMDEALDNALADLNKMRITRRALVPDPRDPTGQKMIESITQRINSRELRELVGAIGQLNKDVNTVMGVPNKVDVTSDGKQVAWPQFITTTA